MQLLASLMLNWTSTEFQVTTLVVIQAIAIVGNGRPILRAIEVFTIIHVTSGTSDNREKGGGLSAASEPFPFLISLTNLLSLLSYYPCCRIQYTCCGVLSAELRLCGRFCPLLDTVNLIRTILFVITNESGLSSRFSPLG